MSVAHGLNRPYLKVLEFQIVTVVFSHAHEAKIIVCKIDTIFQIFPDFMI
jgi:hypothetical protein